VRQIEGDRERLIDLMQRMATPKGSTLGVGKQLYLEGDERGCERDPALAAANLDELIDRAEAPHSAVEHKLVATGKLC
jgi:hypothetical protein